MLAVREFFRRSTEQVESAIARTRAHGRRLTGYLEAVADRLSPRPAARSPTTSRPSRRPGRSTSGTPRRPLAGSAS